MAGRPGAAVRSLATSAYRVPTDRPEADGTLAWSATTVVVVEAGADGATGTGWTYASSACATLVDETLCDVVAGTDPMDVVGAHEAMVRACRNLGRPGVVACGVSAVDVALWDLKARLLGVGLPELLGRCRPDVPVYGSGGFTTYDDATMVAQLERWVGHFGIPRAKIKVGESWGTEEARDLARTGLARRVVGESAELFVDANGGYGRKQAVRVGRRMAEDHGVTWLEEPVSSDDLDGLRLVRDRLDLDVAAGEYGYDEPYFRRMLAAGAVDCLQVDATRCGGYTSWLRAAALAHAAGVRVSGHCAPHLHLPVALHVPNLAHVEYFHDHARLDALLFDGVPPVVDGRLRPDSDAVGHGMVLRPADADRFRIG
ncbi:MAG TPA: enolase C-terminal domain-like protein [Acidimicrobiales bacterium]|nr:enolase C-terminal domain-like protein [Acidimicrobiales bacterium]